MLMRLSHPNILLFRGVNTILFQLALVYDGGGDSNIIQYTASHPDASRIALVRMTIARRENRVTTNPVHTQQLLQAAKGLQYLHSLDVPHGDFRGVSLLSDKSGRFLLPAPLCRTLVPRAYNPNFTEQCSRRRVWPCSFDSIWVGTYKAQSPLHSGSGSTGGGEPPCSRTCWRRKPFGCRVKGRRRLCFCYACLRTMCWPASIPRTVTREDRSLDITRG